MRLQRRRDLEHELVAVVRADGTRRLYAVEPAARAVLRDELDRMWQRALARYALVADNSSAKTRRSRA